MNYKVGVGLLIEDEAFNKVRQIQIDIAEATESDMGLTQPPHITVIRPFVVESQGDVRRLGELLTTTASMIKATTISFSDFSSFDSSTLYLRPDSLGFLEGVRLELEKGVRRGVKVLDDGNDGREMIFHSTISYDLSDSQFEKAFIRLDRHRSLLPIQAKVFNLGLFLQVDRQWIVAHVAPIGE